MKEREKGGGGGGGGGGGKEMIRFNWDEVISTKTKAGLKGIKNQLVMMGEENWRTGTAGLRWWKTN